MLKLNKKGFTIVELVIVIVIVAILAAVLIPTFIGLIRAANTSADIQLVTNLNKALAMQEALDGKNIKRTIKICTASSAQSKEQRTRMQRMQKIGIIRSPSPATGNLYGIME